MSVDPGMALSPAFKNREIAHLSDEQRREFKRNGFLIIENALEVDEVNHYRQVMAELDQTVKKNDGGKAQELSREPGDFMELRNCIAYHDDLLELMVHPKTFPLLLELMGPHIALTTSHAFLRPPSPADAKADFKQIVWHRDGPGYKTIPEDQETPWLYTKIGYFLTDLTIPDAGALRIVPGSHRYNGPAPSDGEHWDPYGVIELKCKAGTAVIFENRILHAVGPNFSPVTRENFYFGYCWRYLRPIDCIQQNSDLLKKCTAIQQQLLGAAAGSCSFYLPQEGDVPLASWPA